MLSSKAPFVLTLHNSCPHYTIGADIINSLSQKIDKSDFEVFDLKTLPKESTAKLNRLAYYQKLGSAKIGLALPGLGYDCLRTWEQLTMGTLVVAERVGGLDRAFYRLPVLLVDDFSAVTTDLLRTAYIEALYRAEEFEYNRLKQSFWWSLIHEVSVSGSNDALARAFPFTENAKD